MRRLADIKPYHNNPRLNDAAVDTVAASIKEFGFRQPIVIDEEGVIIVGHTRYKAALKLGMKKVPVDVARGRTPEQVKAYRVTDNQTNRLSEWDYALLVTELTDLQRVDFDLSVIGFSPTDLESLLGGITEGLIDPNAIPEPPEEATTRIGDLRVLGNHRLLCA